MRFRHLSLLTGALSCLVLCLLACGCGDYVPNHDIIVIRLHDDGSTAWIRTVHTGYDEDARDMIEMKDGDILLAGGNASKRYGSHTSKLIRLAPDGTIRSERSYPEIAGEITSAALAGNGQVSLTTYDGGIFRLDPNGTIIQSTETGMTGVWAQAVTPDGGEVIAGESQDFIPTGSIPEFDRNGTVSTRAPYPNETQETPGCSETMLQAGGKQIPVTRCAATYHDVTQAAITRLDAGGNILWRKSYGPYGLRSGWSVASAGPGQGYLMSAYGNDYAGQELPTKRYAVRLSDNGSIMWVTGIEAYDFYSVSRWEFTPKGNIHWIFSSPRVKPGGSFNIQPTVMDLTAEGNITGSIPVDASPAIIPTGDGGFFSAGFPVNGGTLGYDSEIYGSPEGNNLHAMKFRSDAGKVWDRVVEGISVTSVRQVIQTSDRGYAILALRQNG